MLARPRLRKLSTSAVSMTRTIGVRPSEVKTGQGTRGGGATFARVIGERNDHGGEDGFVIDGSKSGHRCRAELPESGSLRPSTRVPH